MYSLPPPPSASETFSESELEPQRFPYVMATSWVEAAWEDPDPGLSEKNG